MYLNRTLLSSFENTSTNLKGDIRKSKGKHVEKISVFAYYAFFYNLILLIMK